MLVILRMKELTNLLDLLPNFLSFPLIFYPLHYLQKHLWNHMYV